MIAPDFAAHSTAAEKNELEVLVDDYLTACLARSLRSSTVDGHYRPTLTAFVSWAKAVGVTTVDQLTRQVVNRYGVYLQGAIGHTGKPLSQQTRRNRMENLNTWLNWLRTEAEVILRDARGHKPPEPERTYPVLSPDEVRLMLDVAGRRQAGARDHLIVGLLWETGIRVGELVGLQVGDIEQVGQDYFLRVASREHGGGSKSRRDRRVPLPRIHVELRKFVREQRPHSPYDQLFLSSHRNPQSGEYEPLREGGVQEIIGQIAKDAKIGRRIHPHLFRHSAATHWLRNKMEAIVVARILGHKDLKPLYRYYANLEDADRHDAMADVLFVAGKAGKGKR